MKEIQVPGGPPRIRLETWGEIANHLGVEIRTAQRWEQRIELPVRRLDGGQAVFAFVDELDTWRQLREVKGPTAAAIQPPITTGRGRWFYGTLVAVAASALALVFLARPWGVGGDPASLGLEGSRLVAVNAAGATVWTYTFDEPTSVVDASYRHQLKKWWDRLDADGDGVDEVAVVVGHTTGDAPPHDALYVFTLDGQLRYRFVPELSLAFGQQRFEPPWQIMDVEAATFDRQLWVSLANSPWWPAAVVSLDGRGHSTVRYTQPGVVHVLRSFVRSGRGVMLASGVNNEHAAASLAVIDPAQPPGHAPSNGVARYRCDNCPTGAPEQYVLFRPSPANAVVGLPYNRADGLEASATSIKITTQETDAASMVYGLSADLNPLDARPSDTYWVVMDRDRAAGHGAPASTAAQVDTWRPAGWSSISLPYASR